MKNPEISGLDKKSQTRYPEPAGQNFGEVKNMVQRTPQVLTSIIPSLPLEGLDFGDDLFLFNSFATYIDSRETQIMEGQGATYFPSIVRIKSWVRYHCPSITSINFIGSGEILVSFLACESCEVGPNGRQDGERILIPPMLVLLNHERFRVVRGVHPHAKHEGLVCQGDYSVIFRSYKPTFEWIVAALGTIASWRKVYNAKDCYINPSYIQKLTQSQFSKYLDQEVEALDGSIVNMRGLIKMPRGTSRRWCDTCGGEVCWCRTRCGNCGHNRMTGECICCPRCHSSNCSIHSVCGMQACSCVCCRGCREFAWHNPLCERCNDCCQYCSICHNHLKEVCTRCNTPICTMREHRCWTITQEVGEANDAISSS